MARLTDFAEPMRSHLAGLPCQRLDGAPWATGPALAERRVA
jgi:D-proline reductase (dithiol) PrdB